MFKAIIMLTRGADMTHEEFAHWWLVEHAPRAAELPGVRQITFNLVDTEGADVDGISERWFDSQGDFEAAYATDIGKAVAADSMAHVSGRVRMFVTEHSIVE